jgi:hypothetical protein
MQMAPYRAVQILSSLLNCVTNILLQADRSFDSCKPEFKQEPGGTLSVLLSIVAISQSVSPLQQQQQPQAAQCSRFYTNMNESEI